MKKTIGITMLVTLFVVGFCVLADMSGVAMTAKAFGLTAALAVWVGAACWLIDQKPS